MQTYSVKLTDAGDNKLAVLKQMRDIMAIGLRETKDVLDNLGVIASNISIEQAQNIERIINGAGGTVKIKIDENVI